MSSQNQSKTPPKAGKNPFQKSDAKPVFEISYVKISEIKLNTDNPRIIKDHKFKTLVKSIRDFPQMLAIRPIVVNQDMVVLGGNMRLRACQEAGLKEVPILFAESLTPEQQKEFTIKDNVGFGEWNFDMLGNQFEIKELKNWGLEVDFKIEKVAPAGAPDDVPVTPAEPKTKPGDIYEMGDHRLMCGDATNVQHVDALLAGQSVELVYTDPPYGINEQTDRTEFVKTFKKKGVAKEGKYAKIIGDDSIDTAVAAFSVANALAPIIVYWGGNYYSHKLPPSPCWAVWDKRVEDSHRNLNSDCELAYVKHPHKKSVRIFRHLWKGIMKDSERQERRVHPTQKPVALAQWAFDEYASKAKTVLDLFAGSGSTLIAGIRTGRRCFLMEMEPAYCDVIVARFEKFSGLKARLTNSE